MSPDMGSNEVKNENGKGQNSNYRCDIICGSPCCVSIIVTVTSTPNISYWYTSKIKNFKMIFYGIFEGNFTV